MVEQLGLLLEIQPPQRKENTMASVQELLLAAESRNQTKRPFKPLLELANTAFGAYDQGVQVRQRNIETSAKLIQLEQMRQEMQAKQEQEKRFKAWQESQGETGTRNAAKAASGNAPVVTPPQKLQVEWERDSKGNLTEKIKTTDTSAVSPKTYEAGLMAEVAAGRMTLAEAGKLKASQAQGTPDKSMQRAITKAKVDLATTRPMVNAVVSEIERVEKLNATSYGGKAGKVAMAFSRETGIGDESAKFKNTADVVNTMQAQVAKVLKSTFGGQLSDGEREYLNGVYGALPGMNPKERAIAMKNVKTMLSSRLDAAKSTLSELQTDAGGVGADDADIETPEISPEDEAAQFMKGL